MHDPFDRRIGFLGIALVFGRLKNTGKAWDAIEIPLDHLLRSNDYFKGAPFLYVQLAFRYGIKNNLNLEFERINKQYGALPVALELDMEILQWADKNNLELLQDIFMIASLEALIQVAKKYKLPLEPLLEERSQYGDIPSTIEECEKYGSHNQEDEHTVGKTIEEFYENLPKKPPLH
jgi:hypothetical protein